MSKIISVTDVRINELNFYPSTEEMVISLSEHIKNEGQLENATVYVEEKDDGRVYTLIGGETRYRAICKLVEEGISNGDFKVEVIDKPRNIQEELSLITADNVQRKKTIDIRYYEILKLEEIYNQFEEKPDGKKRDWIGQMLGISGRMVDNIKKKFSENSENENSSSTSSQDKLKSSLNRALLNLKKALSMNESLEVLNEECTEKLNTMRDEIKSILQSL